MYKIKNGYIRLELKPDFGAKKSGKYLTLLYIVKRSLNHHFYNLIEEKLASPVATFPQLYKYRYHTRFKEFSTFQKEVMCDTLPAEYLRQT